jgi:hypothetical protein
MMDEPTPGAVASTDQLGHCATERDSWACKNMLPVEGDTSMTHEHYACKVCGRRMALDYDEMR